MQFGFYGLPSADTASSALKIQKYSLQRFPRLNETQLHKNCTHLTASNFWMIVAADDADGLTPIKEDKGRSAKKGRCEAS